MIFSRKRYRRVNLHGMIVTACHDEKGSRQVDVAQASDLIHAFMERLAREWANNPRGVAEMLERRREG